MSLAGGQAPLSHPLTSGEALTVDNIIVLLHRLAVRTYVAEVGVRAALRTETGQRDMRWFRGLFAEIGRK
jgi:hypothetical protein